VDVGLATLSEAFHYVYKAIYFSGFCQSYTIVFRLSAHYQLSAHPTFVTVECKRPLTGEVPMALIFPPLWHFLTI